MILSFIFLIKEFGLEGDHQEINAALAIQLARIWCHEKKDFCQSMHFLSIKHFNIKLSQWLAIFYH